MEDQNNSDYTKIIMDMIMHGGNAKGLAIKAITAVREMNFKESDQLLKKAKTEITLAHQAQTSLFVNETNGQKMDITMLLIHAQDHVMNAITVIEMATETICSFEALYKKIGEIK